MISTTYLSHHCLKLVFHSLCNNCLGIIDIQFTTSSYAHLFHGSETNYHVDSFVQSCMGNSVDLIMFTATIPSAHGKLPILSESHSKVLVLSK